MNKAQKDAIKDFISRYAQPEEKLFSDRPKISKRELQEFIKEKEDLGAWPDLEKVITYMETKNLLFEMKSGVLKLTIVGNYEALDWIKRKKILKAQQEQAVLPVRSRYMIKIYKKAYRILPGKYTIRQPIYRRSGEWETTEIEIEKEMVVNKGTTCVFLFNPYKYDEEYSKGWNKAIEDAKRHIKFYESLAKDNFYHPDTKFYLLYRQKQPAILAIVPLMKELSYDEMGDEKEGIKKRIKELCKKYKVDKNFFHTDRKHHHNYARDEKGDIYYIDMHIVKGYDHRLPKEF